MGSKLLLDRLIGSNISEQDRRPLLKKFLTSSLKIKDYTMKVNKTSVGAGGMYFGSIRNKHQ